MDVAETFFLFEEGHTGIIKCSAVQQRAIDRHEKGYSGQPEGAAQPFFDTLYISGGWSNKPEFLLKGISIGTILQFPYAPGSAIENTANLPVN